MKEEEEENEEKTLTTAEKKAMVAKMVEEERALAEKVDGSLDTLALTRRMMKSAALKLRDRTDEMGLRLEIEHASRSLTEQRRREIQEWCEGVAEWQKVHGGKGR
jgi:hypothetical protein